MHFGEPIRLSLYNNKEAHDRSRHAGYDVDESDGPASDAASGNSHVPIVA
jgi:hypothetical protein